MTTKPRSASEQIIEEVMSWPGVRVARGDMFGELEIKLGRRELGHLHGEHAAHFGFPREILRLSYERAVARHCIDRSPP